MQLTVGEYVNASVDFLIRNGVPAVDIAGAVKSAARNEVARFAESARRRLASASAGKLAEYRVKEEIARDPANAEEVELAMIDREAAARGIDRAALLADISAKAAAYRQIALLVGALEAEAAAAIAAVADDAEDIEAQVMAVLTAAKAQADAAFAEAQAMLAG
jgi:hypothetical protein